MNEKIFSNTTVTQVGIIVRDIEKTSAAYAAAFGVEKPKWFLTDGPEKSMTRYEGDPSPARAKLAFFHFGSLDIELIEPDEHPSTWREFLETKGEGIHHIAFVVKGMADNVSRAGEAGMRLVQKGEYTGGRYAYIDASDSLKTIVELLEND